MGDTTDPDAPCVRHNKNGAQGETRPRYKHPRAVDDRGGVITAVVTTSGDVPEPAKVTALIDGHVHNTGKTAGTAVADRQYGSAESCRQLQGRGVVTHIAPFQPERYSAAGTFLHERFYYDAQRDLYTCPVGQTLHRHLQHELIERAQAQR
jgi:hypothetical protein